MKNTHEQRVSEFAYQIWESEGRPLGHEQRHWEMACKLAETQNDDDVEQDVVEKVTGSIPSLIAPEEPLDPAWEIDPASPQPIHPSDPVQPGNPVQPIQPYASKRTTAAIKSALKEDGVEPAEDKKHAKPRKARSTKKSGSDEPVNS